jgi:hypothetical protein
MKNTYSPNEFGLLIWKTTKTLQRWNRMGVLKAYRSITSATLLYPLSFTDLLIKKLRGSWLLTAHI